MPVAALISTHPANGPHTAGVPVKLDASPKIGAFSNKITHYFTALNSFTSRDCATFQTNCICSVEAQAVCSAGGAAISFALLTPIRRTIGESTVSVQTEPLGGRLPLLEPSALSTAQKETYERLNRTWIPWANDVPFQSKLEDGRLIGPFNPILFSPAISSSLLDLQETEQNNTSLSQRVRQVVILAVGAVWKSNYELYAHAAAARKAGISEDAIRILTTGGLPDELSDQERIAQRYARQLSAERRVDAALYSAAERAFGQRGLVEITYLTGIYHTVCALLNAFEIPAPGS